jgi:putative membrane protein
MSGDADPRMYMAAERTLLAWMRTSLALIAFGFVVARFGVFLRGIAAASVSEPSHGIRPSLLLGIGFVSLGIAMNVVAALRHRRYVAALDVGRFRAAYRSRFAFGAVAVLVVLGIGMLAYLATL